MRWLDNITDSMDVNFINLQERVEDRRAWCGVFHEFAKSQTQLNEWTPTIMLSGRSLIQIKVHTILFHLYEILEWGKLSKMTEDISFYLRAR